MNIADPLGRLILWTLELFHDLVETFVAIFSKRTRIKWRLHHWVRRNCPPLSATDQPVSARLVHLVQSDSWVDGSLIRLVGQSLDPEPHADVSWPEPDWHVGQSSILRRLHIQPVFTKSDITSHRFSPRHIEDTLIEYLTRVRNKIEQNRSLYTLYEREKRDLTNYDNLSELEISLDFKAANQMDPSNPQGESAQSLPPVQTRSSQEAKLKSSTHKETTMTVNQQRAQEFIARGTGLMYGKTGQKNTFYIYCKDLAAELNNIVIEINTRAAYNFVNINNQLIDTELFHTRNLHNDIVIQYRSNSEYVKVTYECKREGKYEIRVTYYGYNIPGSPFLLNIEHTKEPEEIQIRTCRPSSDHTSDDKTEWIDLPGKRKPIKRSMSTLPSLCRLRKQKFFEETFENDSEPLTEHSEIVPSNGNSRESKTLKEEDCLIKTGKEECIDAQDRKILQRSVSKFYEYESTESNATEKSDETLKNKNINPILTLFESFDLQQSSQRKGRHRRRNLTYSNSNMKRYSKLILNNQDLFQIVTKLDFVVKTLNTNELLDILGDVRNKLELIEKYDKDIQSLRKQKCDEKKFNADQISLISEYFTLMHAQLSRKFDSIAKLISDNIEEIDIELQQDEKNELEGDNYDKGKCEFIPELVKKYQCEIQTIEDRVLEHQEDSTCSSTVAQSSDILRAKQAREKFQKRGNSKKRYDQQKSSSSESTTKERLQASNTMGSSFTEIKLSPSTIELPIESEHETSEISYKIVPVKTIQQNSQLTFHKSLTISVEFSDHEVLLESQNQFSEPDIPQTCTVDIRNSLIKQTEINDENYQEDKNERKNSGEHLVHGKTQSLDISKELIFNESQSELKPLKLGSEDTEKLNNNMALENSQSYKEKMPDAEREENVRDNYCIQSKKFSEKEKVEQRQTNLHIKETNFHCTANLNKNNLKIYDNEDKNERKEDYFRFYALNSEDNIDCDNGLNYSQITNVRDLHNSQQRKEKYEITMEENELQNKCAKVECEKNIKNLEQKEGFFRETVCSVSDENNDVAIVHDKNEEETDHVQSKETRLSNEIIQSKETSLSNELLDLKESVGLEINQYKQLSIKINKNDLYSGKFLTVDCPKENMGNTIQMKIELCKCSCVETISTQTEDTRTEDNTTMQDEQIQDEGKLIEIKIPYKEQEINNYEIKKEEILGENVLENNITQEDNLLINENCDKIKDENKYKELHLAFHDKKHKLEEENLTELKVNKRDHKDKQIEEKSEQKLVGSVFDSKKYKLELENITKRNASHNQFTLQESNTSLKVNKRDSTIEPNENDNEQTLEKGLLKNQKHTLKNNKQMTNIVKTDSLEIIEPIQTKITIFNNQPFSCHLKNTTVNDKVKNTVPKQTHEIFQNIEVFESKLSPTESEIPRGLVNQLIGKYEKPAPKSQKSINNEEDRTKDVSTMAEKDLIKNSKVTQEMISTVQSNCSPERNNTSNVTPDIHLPHEIKPEPNQKCNKTITNLGYTECRIPYVVDTSEVITIQNYHDTYINDNSQDLKLSYSSSTDFESLENMYVLIENQGIHKSLNPEVQGFDSSIRNDYKIIQIKTNFNVEEEVKELHNKIIDNEVTDAVISTVNIGVKELPIKIENKEITVSTETTIDKRVQELQIKKEYKEAETIKNEKLKELPINVEFKKITVEEVTTVDGRVGELPVQIENIEITVPRETAIDEGVQELPIIIESKEINSKAVNAIVEEVKDLPINVEVKEITVEGVTTVDGRVGELPIQIENIEITVPTETAINEGIQELPIIIELKEINSKAVTAIVEEVKELPIKIEGNEITDQIDHTIDKGKLTIKIRDEIISQMETMIDEGNKDQPTTILGKNITAEAVSKKEKEDIEMPIKLEIDIIGPTETETDREQDTTSDKEFKLPIKIDDKGATVSTETTTEDEIKELPVKKENMDITAEAETTIEKGVREILIKMEDNETPAEAKNTMDEGVRKLPIKIEDNEITAEAVNTVVEKIRELPIKIEDKETIAEMVTIIDEEVRELLIKREDKHITAEAVTIINEGLSKIPIRIEVKESTAEAVTKLVEVVMELPIKIEDKESIVETITTIDEEVRELLIKREDKHITAEAATEINEGLSKIPIKIEGKESSTAETVTKLDELAMELPIKIEDKETTTKAATSIDEDKEISAVMVTTIDERVKKLPIKIEDKETLSEVVTMIDERVREQPIKIEHKEISADVVSTLNKRVRELHINIEEKESTAEVETTTNKRENEQPNTKRIEHKEITGEKVSNTDKKIRELLIKKEYKDITVESVNTIDEEVREIPTKIEELDNTADKQLKKLSVKINEKKTTVNTDSITDEEVKELPIKNKEKEISTEEKNTIHDVPRELPIKIEDKEISAEEVITIDEVIRELPMKIEEKHITAEAVSTINEIIRGLPIKLEDEETNSVLETKIYEEVKELPNKIEHNEIVSQVVTEKNKVPIKIKNECMSTQAETSFDEEIMELPIKLEDIDIIVEVVTTVDEVVNELPIILQDKDINVEAGTTTLDERVKELTIKIENKEITAQMETTMDERENLLKIENKESGTIAITTIDEKVMELIMKIEDKVVAAETVSTRDERVKEQPIKIEDKEITDEVVTIIDEAELSIKIKGKEMIAETDTTINVGEPPIRKEDNEITIEAVTKINDEVKELPFKIKYKEITAETVTRIDEGLKELPHNIENIEITDEDELQYRKEDERNNFKEFKNLPIQDIEETVQSEIIEEEMKKLKIDTKETGVRSQPQTTVIEENEEPTTRTEYKIVPVQAAEELSIKIGSVQQETTLEDEVIDLFTESKDKAITDQAGISIYEQKELLPIKQEEINCESEITKEYITLKEETKETTTIGDMKVPLIDEVNEIKEEIMIESKNTSVLGQGKTKDNTTIEEVKYMLAERKAEDVVAKSRVTDVKELTIETKYEKTVESKMLIEESNELSTKAENEEINAQVDTSIDEVQYLPFEEIGKKSTADADNQTITISEVKALAIIEIDKKNNDQVVIKENITDEVVKEIHTKAEENKKTPVEEEINNLIIETKENKIMVQVEVEKDQTEEKKQELNTKVEKRDNTDEAANKNTVIEVEVKEKTTETKDEETIIQIENATAEELNDLLSAVKMKGDIDTENSEMKFEEVNELIIEVKETGTTIQNETGGNTTNEKENPKELSTEVKNAVKTESEPIVTVEEVKELTQEIIDKGIVYAKNNNTSNVEDFKELFIATKDKGFNVQVDTDEAKELHTTEKNKENVAQGENEKSSIGKVQDSTIETEDETTNIQVVTEEKSTHEDTKTLHNTEKDEELSTKLDDKKILAKEETEETIKVDEVIGWEKNSYSIDQVKIKENSTGEKDKELFVSAEDQGHSVEVENKNIEIEKVGKLTIETKYKEITRQVEGKGNITKEEKEELLDEVEDKEAPIREKSEDKIKEVEELTSDIRDKEITLGVNTMDTTEEKVNKITLKGVGNEIIIKAKINDILSTQKVDKLTVDAEIKEMNNEKQGQDIISETEQADNRFEIESQYKETKETVDILTNKAETDECTTKVLSKTENELPELTETKELTVRERYLEDRPVSPSTCPTKRMKCPKFIIRKTYFEHLASTDKISTTCKKSLNYNKEEFQSDTVKSKRDMFSKLSCGVKELDTQNTNLAMDSVNSKIKSPQVYTNFFRKSIESLEPSVQIKRTIFESENRDIQEKEFASKLHSHDSLESIEEVVKINKCIFEKENKNHEEDATSILQNPLNQHDNLEIKAKIVESEKAAFERETQDSEDDKSAKIIRHESLASLAAVVKNKKTMFEKGNRVNEVHVNSTVTIPSILHDSLGVVEQTTKDQNIVIKTEIEETGDISKEKLKRHGSLDTIEKTVKTKQTFFENFDRKIRGTNIEETPCDISDCKDNFGKLNMERKIIFENVNQCVKVKLEKHDSLETLEEMVKKKRTIFENECQEIDNIKREQLKNPRNHRDVSPLPIEENLKNQTIILNKNHYVGEVTPPGKIFEHTRLFDNPVTEPVAIAVSNIDEEIVIYVDNDKSKPTSTLSTLGRDLEISEEDISLKSECTPVEDKLSSCNSEIPVFTEFNNVYENQETKKKMDMEFSRSSGNINLKKAIFEKELLSPLQEMKVTHDSLDYIEPIVTSIKNVFERKSRGSDGKGMSSVENLQSEESHVPDYLCNEENNPEKQVLSSRRRNLCETNRLTETYVNSMRLSEAIESKVNSERDNGIESQGNVSHMQTNDENCINSIPICNTGNLQGVTEALNTGFTLSELEVKRESDSLKVEFDNCSKSQIEKSSINLRSEEITSKNEHTSISTIEEIQITETKDHYTAMEVSPEKDKSLFISNISSPFFDSQDNTEEFLTWASNEEFSKPDVKNEPENNNFQIHITNITLNNLISDQDEDISSNNLSSTVPQALGSLEVEGSPGIQENLSSKVSFQLGSPDGESNLDHEKLCDDESNESSLDYDSIIQAPSLDEALEKLDLKLKKEVIKDFKNDTEKLELFHKNKSIQGVTDEAGKLKFCFNVTDEEGISNSKWEGSMFFLKSESESRRCTSPVISFPDEPTMSAIKTPKKSSKYMTSESMQNQGFNIVELKEPTDILLMGPAEKEIVWGITDEEAVQIFQQSCAEGNETYQTDLMRKSPEPGKLHHPQPRRSPSPLASFLNSSLSTIDETQEYFYTSVDNADDVATVRLTHTHSLIYRSDSETSVKEEELDLKRISTLNPSIHITNYDIENFVDNDKKTLQWNNEKIIEVILEDALLRPRSNNQNYENDPIVLENNETIEKNKTNDYTEDHKLGDINNDGIQEIHRTSECVEPVKDVIDTIIIDSLDCKTKNMDVCVNEKKEQVQLIDIMRENDDKVLGQKDEFDFECKPEFVQKWKNYWDERFSQNKEMQESLNRSLSDEAKKILQSRRSPCLEVNENFVSKQRRIFENEINLDTKNQIESNVFFSNKNIKTNTKQSHQNNKEEEIVDEAGDFRSDEIPVKAKVPPQHIIDFSHHSNNLRRINFPRKPSIKVKDIVKKQKQKFESLFRSSFKSKKVKVSKQEYSKESKNPNFSIPLVSPRKETRRKTVDKSQNEVPSILNQPIVDLPCRIRTSVSPLMKPLDKEDSLSATFKIMKDVNMIPQNQTFDEWRQSYSQQITRNMDTSEPIDQTSESQREQKFDPKLDSNSTDITQRDEHFDNLTDKMRSQNTQECHGRKEKQAEDCQISNNIQPIEKVVSKEIDAHLSFSSQGAKSEITCGQVESIKVSVEDTHCRESNLSESELICEAKEYETVKDTNNQEPSHSNIEVISDVNDPLQVTSNAEVQADLTSPDEIPDDMKYSPEYPYLPKTPVDEYQHRSDLYKELVTRKQLFKLTQFVKK